MLLESITMRRASSGYWGLPDRNGLRLWDAKRSGFSLLLLGLALAGPAAAADKSGVTPGRLHLPEAPGSLMGIGENVEPNLSMGLMTYRVPIVVPEGYPGTTPTLALTYDSGSGNGLLGIGWTLPTPSIERMTARGLPHYTESDTFVADGGQELVRIPDTDGVYRARFEGSFVRYTWVDEEGDGAEGYFIAEYPDGRVGYFGATADGESVEAARVTGSGGTFRYHLVDMLDVLGHVTHYEYEDDGGFAELSRISYVFDGDEARYEVRFTYEERPDVLSDARPGVMLERSERMDGASVLVDGETLRRYVFNYESASASGGLSRLSKVRWFGADDGEYPVVLGFGYSSGLMDAAPAAVEMGGALGLDLAAGSADLVDMNSDGLPDVVDTAGGQHRIFLNQMSDGEEQRFLDPVDSTVGSVALSSPSSEMLDLDGDGRTDMVDSELGLVLWNHGAGDWDAEEQPDGFNLPNLADDANLRFFDFDDDKLIDALHADRTGSWVYANRGEGRFERVDLDAESIGASFVEDALSLADMNGDGLLDCVRQATGLFAYRTNLGFGRFAPWLEMSGLPANFAPGVELVDLNGDGLTDLVSVLGDDVRYAMNRNGKSFASESSLRDDAGIDVPVRDPGTSVRFADMNASGSTDIVYVSSSGAVTYLELFPERPNLLTRIDNGIGKVIDVAYGASARHMQADGGVDAWDYRLPQVMVTVDEVSVRDERSGVEQRQLIHYSNGYYDGTERQFQGYRDVAVSVPGDESAESGSVRYVFDVGVDDPYRKGLLLSQVNESDGDVITSVENGYDDCEVAEVDDASPAVRYVCQTASTRQVVERESSSRSVTTRENYGYDAYGNRSLNERLGMTEVDGDESYEETTFIAPSPTGPWLLDKPSRVVRSNTSDGALKSDERFYYDGEPFRGLAAGRLTQGLLTRVSARVSDAGDAFVDRERYAYDENGAVVASLDANGHRRNFEYDPTGRLLRSEELVFDDAGHDAYSLRITADYDPLLDTMVRASAWMRFVGGEAMSEERPTRYDWDEFGRLIAVARPGDSLDEPTDTYSYRLSATESSITHRARSQSGGEFDIESVQCFDGLGRALEKRQRVKSGTYQVSGLSEFNTLGLPFREYQPSLSDSARCGEPDPDVLFTSTSYDATGRPLSIESPDAALYDTSSRKTFRYLPLRVEVWDEEDTDPMSPHFETPTVVESDGLGRKVRLERLIHDPDGGSTPARVSLELHYDALSRFSGYTDAAGNQKLQEYDLLGRVLRVVDPDSGTSEFGYDDAGNQVTATDARGVEVERNYDEANRVTAEWNAIDAARSWTEYHYDVAEDCERCANVAGALALVRYPIDPERRIEGSDRFGYDSRSQPTYQERQFGCHRFAIETEFDDAGRPIARSFPSGQRIESRLDGLGRTSEIPGIVDATKYNDRGLLRQLDFSNGARTEYLYDALGRLAGLTTKGSQGALLDLSYRRDRVGNLLSVIDADTRMGEPSENADFTYDDWYRLTLAELDKGRDGEETLTTEFDHLDAIRKRTSSLGATSPAHVGTYLYGAERPHTPSSAGALDLAYDDAGNVVERGEDRYSWDFLGRIHTVARSGAETARFGYGPDRTRVMKAENGHVTYYVAPDFEVRDGEALVYVSLGDRKAARIEVPEYAVTVLGDLAPGTFEGDTFVPEADGKITAADAWIAQSLTNGELHLADDACATDTRVDELLAATTRRLLGVTETTTTTFLHTDHLGSIVRTSDEYGGEISRSSYYPGGLPRSENANFSDDRGFLGEEHDESGLISLGARYLDPTLLLWTSPDPLGVALEADGALSGELIQRYAYAKNSPLTLQDRGGFWSSKRIWGIADNVHQQAVSKIGKQMGVPKSGIKEMRKAQVEIDKEQGNEVQHKHAMVGKGMDRDKAIEDANKFVNERLTTAIKLAREGKESEAWKAVGEAVHTVQDSTSPEHRGFQEWDNDAGLLTQAGHGMSEMDYPGKKSGERAQLEGGTRWVIRLFQENSKPGAPEFQGGVTFFDRHGMLNLPIDPGSSTSQGSSALPSSANKP